MLVLAAPLPAADAQVAKWPEKTVRMIVPLAPGGGTDIVARMFAAPATIHGQVHGGIAQGVGQALMEQCYYDPDTGQLLTGSFMDYAMPAPTISRFSTPNTSRSPPPHTRSACVRAAKAGRRLRSVS